MATLEETADLMAQNIAGLMMVFTPEGMMKAMAMQGQLQARAAEAIAAGRTPAPATGYRLETKRQDGEDQVIAIHMDSPDGTAEMLTRWREVEGLWKVNDLVLVRANDAEGNPVDISGSTPASPS